MAVKLRLMRFGKKNRPCYRVCAIDGRAPRDGAYIESIGTYDPYIENDRQKVQIKKDRAEYWLSVGAQPSETVASFLRKINVAGLIRPKKPRKKRVRKSKKSTKKAEGTKKPKPPKKPREQKED